MIYLEGASWASLYLTNSSDLTISCCLLKPFPEQWLKQDMTGLSHFGFQHVPQWWAWGWGWCVKTQKASIKRIERIWQPYCKWKTVCAFVWNSTVLSQNRQLLSHGFQSHSYTNTMQANPVYFCQIPAGSLYCACYSNIAQSKATVLAKTPKKSILGSWMGSSGMSH